MRMQIPHIHAIYSFAQQYGITAGEATILECEFFERGIQQPQCQVENVEMTAKLRNMFNYIDNSNGICVCL